MTLPCGVSSHPETRTLTIAACLTHGVEGAIVRAILICAPGVFFRRDTHSACQTSLHSISGKAVGGV